VHLFRDRIVSGRLEDSPEVRSQRFSHSHVGLVAEQHVLVLLIDPREVSQERPNVGADAEVVQLPRIDGDSHSKEL
jgi:hypothetical protein